MIRLTMIQLHVLLVAHVESRPVYATKPEWVKAFTGLAAEGLLETNAGDGCVEGRITRAGCDRLREACGKTSERAAVDQAIAAIRRVAIHRVTHSPSPLEIWKCSACDSYWKIGEAERHAPDCLAREDVSNG